MSQELRLDGTTIPRRIKRMFDQRGEPRADQAASALVEWRGAALAVSVLNVSRSGAMVSCNEIPHVGEAVALQLPNRAPISGVVRWVRGGRIGIHFAVPSE